ncbi:hypothetical protein SKAU_G00129840 [Synaphobranchus kaupii]|uniref:Uncharacterized protein n=1 Tax=Synaphobranchus kaupii TaxID=118154 RepID=A0A9Q1FQC9_SYNKA|nr:hypothetical protein SKAU_G00129840 [Synaphobranchus kaupii]
MPFQRTKERSNPGGDAPADTLKKNIAPLITQAMSVAKSVAMTVEQFTTKLCMLQNGVFASRLYDKASCL